MHNQYIILIKNVREGPFCLGPQSALAWSTPFKHIPSCAVTLAAALCMPILLHSALSAETRHFPIQYFSDVWSFKRGEMLAPKPAAACPFQSSQGSLWQYHLAQAVGLLQGPSIRLHLPTRQRPNKSLQQGSPFLSWVCSVQLSKPASVYRSIMLKDMYRSIMLKDSQALPARARLNQHKL